MVRHNNQLPDNLPQLQNLIKRDPESYKEEVRFSHPLKKFNLFFVYLIVKIFYSSFNNTIILNHFWKYSV